MALKQSGVRHETSVRSIALCGCGINIGVRELYCMLNQKGHRWLRRR
jgi:hypothetical protein